MALTQAAFLDSYPEFTNAPSDMLTAELANAILQCPSAVWGDFADMGAALTLARRLAMSPYAREMNLKNEDGSTIYDAELKRLRVIVASGGRVV